VGACTSGRGRCVPCCAPESKGRSAGRCLLPPHRPRTTPAGLAVDRGSELGILDASEYGGTRGALHKRRICTPHAYAHRMHMHTACVCTPHAYAHRMHMHTACVCTPHAYAHRMRMHTAYHPWRVLGACGHRSRACSGWRCRTLPSWRARACRPRCSQSSATSARWVARIVNACKEGCIDAMHRRHAQTPCIDAMHAPRSSPC
jgi:hypothetical protein